MIDLIKELSEYRPLYEKLLGDLVVSQQNSIKINFCVLSEDQTNYTKIVFESIRSTNHFKKYLTEKRVFILVEGNQGTNIFANSKLAQQLKTNSLASKDKQIKVVELNDQEFCNIIELVQTKLEEASKKETLKSAFGIRKLDSFSPISQSIVRLFIRLETQVSRIILRCLERMSEARRQEDARAKEDAKRKEEKIFQIKKDEIDKAILKQSITKEEIKKIQNSD